MEQWCTLGLPLPESIPQEQHLRDLTRLLTGHPRAWKPTEILAAMERVAADRDGWAWVIRRGPGYLVYRIDHGNGEQVIERILTWQPHQSHALHRETAEERARRLFPGNS